MSAAIASHAAERVRSAMGELSDQGVALVALGQALQDLAGLPGSATADELKHASLGVSATAMRAQTAVLCAELVGERLATLARVLEVEP